MTDPLNTVAPALTYPGLSGSNLPQVGQVVTCDGGTWTTAYPPIGLQYGWLRAQVNTWTNITGANPGGPTYTPVAADIGYKLKCAVTAFTGAGPFTSSFSNATTAVTTAVGSPPENVVAPSIGTVGNVGIPVICSPGTWIGETPFTYAYQWEEYIASVWTKIAGATSVSYSPAVAVVGKTIRCVVLVANVVGYVPAASNSLVVGNSGTAALTSPVASLRPQRRGLKWYRDVDGILSTEKQYEDIDVDVQDWSDALGGETISSAAWNTDGIIVNSSSYDITTTTVAVTGIGSCHVDITTSGGRTFREYFRWRRLHRPVMGTMGGGSTLPGEDYR